MKNQQLVCSVQTVSFDPSGSQSLAHEYGQLIIQKMRVQGILERKVDHFRK